VTALVTDIPSGIIRMSFCHRMTPVLWWNYPVRAVTALLSGLILATCPHKRRAGQAPITRQRQRRNAIPVVVGCPLCNKIVVALAGSLGR
jgi:hypothetical protein